jgi:hypothetical protein
MVYSPQFTGILPDAVIAILTSISVALHSAKAIIYVIPAKKWIPFIGSTLVEVDYTLTVCCDLIDSILSGNLSIGETKKVLQELKDEIQSTLDLFKQIGLVSKFGLTAVVELLQPLVDQIQWAIDQLPD